jgi:hypothetical protein
MPKLLCSVSISRLVMEITELGNTFSLNSFIFLYTNNEDNRILWNIGIHLVHYTTSNPRETCLEKPWKNQNTFSIKPPFLYVSILYAWGASKHFLHWPVGALTGIMQLCAARYLSVNLLQTSVVTCCNRTPHSFANDYYVSLVSTFWDCCSPTKWLRKWLSNRKFGFGLTFKTSFSDIWDT